MKTLSTLVLIAFLSFIPPANAGPPEGWEFGRLDQSLANARDVGMRVFVYFGRQGCPVCERTNRESFTDPRVVEAYTASYVLAYVDSESGRRLRLSSGERITEMELGVKLNVYGTPFFFFIEPDGTPIVRAPGYQSADDLLLLHRFVSEGHYRNQSFDAFRAQNS